MQPPPGRVFLVSPDHTFDQLAQAINIGFARWDLSRLYQFTLPTGEVIGPGDDDAPPEELVAEETRVGTLLIPGSEFDYVFDLGHEWTHSCRVDGEQSDPVAEYSVEPKMPIPIWGWGTIPDQYGREEPDD